MTHLILTGATGLAGSGILAYALQSPSISHISILSRRPVKQAENQAKATVFIQQDFTSYSAETLARLKSADACIFALGTSSAGIAEAEYTEITRDYPLAAAKALAGVRPDGRPFRFVYVSGEGARLDGKGVMFARVKGAAERALLDLGERDPDGLSVYNVRPGGILARNGAMAEREQTVLMRAVAVLGSVMGVLAKKYTIGTDVLAKASIRLAEGDGKALDGEGVEAGGRVVRNTRLRQMGGAD